MQRRNGVAATTCGHHWQRPLPADAVCVCSCLEGTSVFNLIIAIGGPFLNDEIPQSVTRKNTDPHSVLVRSRPDRGRRCPQTGSIVADSITTRCPNNQTLPVRPLVDSPIHPFADSLAWHVDHPHPL